MELNKNPQDYLQYLNRIFKLIDNSKYWEKVEIDINPKISLKDYIMLYYNTIETNVDKVIPYNFYRKVLQSLPLFPHKRGYIYKCESCGFYMVMNPSSRINYVPEKFVKTPILCGFSDIVSLNNYIAHFIETYDNVNRIQRKFDVNGIESYNIALFNEYHEKNASNRCQEVILKRYKGFRDTYKPNKILNALSIHNRTKDPTTQYTNLVNLYLPYMRNEQYTTSSFEIEEIQRLSHLYISKKQRDNLLFGMNIAVVYAVFTLLICNKYLTKEKLTEKLNLKKDKYPFVTLREISNFFGINFITISREIKSIINTILADADFSI